MDQPASGRRRVRVAGAVMALAAVIAGGVWLRDFLPISSQALEQRIEGRTDVIDVAVTADDGDDGLPFPLMRITQDVEVVMPEDATAEAVSDVLAAYADDIEDGDVLGVTIRLQGARTVLITCCGTQANDAVIADFLEAAQDPHVMSYSREAVPVLSIIEVALEPLPFDDVAAYLVRYGSIEPAEHVSVESGDFLIIRDEQFGERSLARIDARVQVVSRLVRKFGLAGAAIADRSALELRLDVPSDEAAVRRYLAETTDDAAIGKVRFLSAPRG